MRFINQRDRFFSLRVDSSTADCPKPDAGRNALVRRADRIADEEGGIVAVDIRLKRQIISLSATLLLISMVWSASAWGQAFRSGLNFISASQNPTTGMWGAPDGTLLRDSTVVLETLALAGQVGSTFTQGVAGTADRSAMNNDDRARQAAILRRAGKDVSLLLDELLASQNPEIFDPAQRDFPGRGWGLAASFGNSTIDTALALRALQAAGFPGVLSIVRENLIADGTGPSRPFTVPSGATDLMLKVQQVGGGTVRFLLKQPNMASLFIDIPPGGAPVRVALPLSVGSWSFWTENLSGTPATYTAEIAFIGPDGFDHFRITDTLTYLGLAQNNDGGWGLAPGEDSHLMVTTEVVRALAGSGGAFGPGQTLTAAANWLRSFQNPDGGFSSEAGLSNPNETGLAAVAIGLADPGASLESAATFLEGIQLPGGSWGNDAYLTAIAMQALQVAGKGLEPLIFKDSFEQ